MRRQSTILIIGSIFTLMLVNLLGLWHFTGMGAVVYASPPLDSGYVVTIKESGVRFALPHMIPRYEMHIAMKNARGGHSVDVSLFNMDEPATAYIRRGKIWENTAGITFQQPSGHTVFVPRAWYTGGR